MGKPIEFRPLIVWENEDYIAVNKPSELSSLTDRDETKTNLLELAKEYEPSAQLCHRLDKETTGILMIAKNAEAYRNLAIQFEEREVGKEYHAVVNGLHHFQNTLVDLPLSTTSKGKSKVDKFLGKFAETTFNTEETYFKHSLVSCEPVTGRLHQIRIHLSCINAPIVCDEDYGGAPIYLSEIKRNFNLKRGTVERPLISRFALHAFKISFKGRDGSPIQVEAPYPKDFRALVNQLQKNK